MHHIPTKILLLIACLGMLSAASAARADEGETHDAGVAVPDVRDLPEKEALRRLQAAGLHAAVTERPDVDDLERQFGRRTR